MGKITTTHDGRSQNKNDTTLRMLKYIVGLLFCQKKKKKVKK